MFRVAFDLRLLVDVRREHSDLRDKAMSPKSVSLAKEVSSASYYDDFEKKSYETQETTQESFLPFFIVRRMEFRVDADKIREVMSRRDCSIRDL